MSYFIKHLKKLLLLTICLLISTIDQAQAQNLSPSATPNPSPAGTSIDDRKPIANPSGVACSKCFCKLRHSFQRWNDYEHGGIVPKVGSKGGPEDPMEDIGDLEKKFIIGGWFETPSEGTARTSQKIDYPLYSDDCDAENYYHVRDVKNTGEELVGRMRISNNCKKEEDVHPAMCMPGVYGRPGIDDRVKYCDCYIDGINVEDLQKNKKNKSASNQSEQEIIRAFVRTPRECSSLNKTTTATFIVSPSDEQYPGPPTTGKLVQKVECFPSDDQV